MAFFLGFDPFLVAQVVDEMSNDGRLADSFAAEKGDSQLGERRRSLRLLLGHQNHDQSRSNELGMERTERKLMTGQFKFHEFRFKIKFIHEILEIQYSNFPDLSEDA